MRKILIAIVVFILLVSCAPSPEAIQKAIEQTQAAMVTNTPEPTNTPKPSSTPTRKPSPTVTMTPEPNYILETGFCIMSVNYISGDPEETAGCGRDEREQLHLASNQDVTVTFSYRVNELQWYCALFDLSHNLIMVDVDTTGSGKATCHP